MEVTTREEQDATQKPEILINTHPITSAAATRSVIADMRKTLTMPGMVLDMWRFATQFSDGCRVCAGGSAVIHGMGGAWNEFAWTDDQWEVAHYFNDIRRGNLDECGIPHMAPYWSEAMKDCTDQEEFFAAWEAFADAQERFELEGVA